MAHLDDDLKEILKQIRKLDLEAKSINNKRVQLIHRLESVLEVDAITALRLPLEEIYYRRGERIEITNKVTSGVYGSKPGIQDARGTVTIQKKTDRGQVKVFFETDRGVNTHRLSKNIRRVDPKDRYEVQRREATRAAGKPAKQIQPELPPSSSK
jgi:hypothetical protein